MADAISQCIEAWQTHSTKADLRSQLRSLWDANIEIPDYEIANAFSNQTTLAVRPIKYHHVRQARACVIHYPLRS